MMKGKRIGKRYEIIRAIGEGGMSRVYLARDIILDRDVAIKVLHYDFADEEELKKRFQREALSATSLSHPHIVNIFDVGQEDELHYLVMEYISGRTLKEYIQTNGPLPAESAAAIMQQLVSAIAHAHHNGIIHRDIKPQNVLMNGSDDVKITDFGIAMALNSTVHTKTNSVLGTVHYLSPEQARGGMATKRSDIYSLGIVFYELLTGKLPFSAETAVAIALKHLQEETPSVRGQMPGIPQSIENIILKATAKDADARYQSADEMYDDLLTALSPERAGEEKFTVPFDEDQTMVMPAVKPNTPAGGTNDLNKTAPLQTEEAELPEKKKRRKWPWIVLLALVVITGAAAAAFQLTKPKEITVPQVVGEEEVTAVETLEGEGFVIDDRFEESSEEIEAGRVTRTVPEANKKRREGDGVKLFISTGKDKMVLTDFISRNYEATKKFLDPYKFKSVEAVYVHSDETAGTIIDQQPEAEQQVIPEETSIIFTVSLGKKLHSLEDLEGMTNEQLDAYAASSGLNIHTAEEYSDKVEKGRVISQKPSKGTQMDKGGRVDVVISKGPEAKPVKLLVKTVKIPYAFTEEQQEIDEEHEEEEEIEAVPQKIQIYIQDRSHTMNDPFEEFEITEDSERKITIELEEGQRGGYKIMRDQTVILEEKFEYKDLK